MTLLSAPSPIMPVAVARERGERARIDWRAVAAVVLGFLTFMPYPAITAGHATAIQMGDLCSLLLVLPILFVPWRRRPYHLYLLILIPLCLSALKVAACGESQLDVSVKTILSWALTCLTLLAAQLYLPRYSTRIMTGIALAALVHVLVGAWQVYVFQSGGELPLLNLYVNSSFLSVQDHATAVVRYERRPFGLFPEPSAMSSSLAPWILLWVAEMAGLVRFLTPPTRRQRTLFVAATVGGLALIIWSRSGHALGVLAVLLVFGAAWLWRARATPRNFLAALFVFAVVVPLAGWVAVVALGDRVRNESRSVADSSWEERSKSMVIGFGLWSKGDAATIFLGMGAGRSAAAMQTSSAHLEAVFSGALAYLYETGVVGAAIVFGGIGYFVTRAWRASRFGLVFGSILAVWLLGVTVTTSYLQLLPVWMALGLLTVWPEVCATSPKRIAAAPVAGAGPFFVREPPSAPWDSD